MEKIPLEKKTIPEKRLEIVSRIDEGPTRFRIVRDNETGKEFLVSILSTSTVNGVSMDVKEL